MLECTHNAPLKAPVHNFLTCSLLSALIHVLVHIIYCYLTCFIFVTFIFVCIYLFFEFIYILPFHSKTILYPARFSLVRLSFYGIFHTCSQYFLLNNLNLSLPWIFCWGIKIFTCKGQLSHPLEHERGKLPPHIKLLCNTSRRNAPRDCIVISGPYCIELPNLYCILNVLFLGILKIVSCPNHPRVTRVKTVWVHNFSFNLMDAASICSLFVHSKNSWPRTA